MLVIPEAMASYRQFILWIAEPSRTRPGKTDKFPIHPLTGRVSGIDNPEIHLSGIEAQAYLAAGQGHGVGFVIQESDPFFFFDIDSCYDTAAQAWSPFAVQMCQAFAGCFVEVSQSGTGLHIIGSGVPRNHRCKPPQGSSQQDIELYTKDRFVALTGTSAQGSPAWVAQPQLDWLIDNHFPPRTEAADAEWTDGPCEGYGGPADDQALIAKMLASAGSVSAIFGARATFRDLWEANEDALAKHYPDPARDFDHNRADAALMQHLAFWTGRDCERMDRLFRLSGLNRGKWEDREGYRRNTILHAVGFCTEVYAGPQAKLAPTPDQPASIIGRPEPGQLRDGIQFKAITEQIDYFKGCVYVRSERGIYVPDGEILDQGQFRVAYGGFTYALDLVNDKTTQNAYQAFTESQGYTFPQAHALCFRPECEPGGTVEEEGRTLLNTYVPVPTRREKGDPAPFLDLLARILPDERDRTILLSYMAAVVQNPGYKIQWWPVLQGTEGNGKSAVIRVLNHACGNRYSHVITNPKSLVESGGKFNAWVDRKLFVGIEEIYTPERRDFLEAFKTTITNDWLQIEGKGTNQRMGDNRANGVMCTNHKDGIPITADTRRYCIFFTAQQNKEDKARDGLTGDYFPAFYNWCKGAGAWESQGRNYGYAVVTDYLANYAIPPEFDPTGLAQEAPRTSSTPEALKVSMGPVEQDLQEAIAEGLPGFANGWVSSKAIDSRLRHGRGKSITPAKIEPIMKSLGYVLHPGLREGRVNNTINDPAGAGKPRLFIMDGHPMALLTTPADIARSYVEAQAGTSMAAQAFGGAA